MGDQKKFLEYVKLYGKKALIIVLSIVLVVNSGSIAAAVEGMVEQIQEQSAEVDNATAIPEGQTEGSNGEITSEVTKEPEDVQLYFSGENVTFTTTDGQTIGGSQNVPATSDFSFRASANEGYENLSVSYNGSTLSGDGYYTIYATQLSSGATVSASATAIPQVEPQTIEAATSITEAQESLEGSDTASEEPAAETESPETATTDAAETAPAATTEPAATTDAALTDEAATTDSAETSGAETPAATDNAESEPAATDEATTEEPASTTETAETEAATTEAATTDEAETPEAETEAAETTTTENTNTGILGWLGNLFNGTSTTAETGTIATAGSDLGNYDASTTGTIVMELSDTATLKGTETAYKTDWETTSNLTHSWATSDASVVSVTNNKSWGSVKSSQVITANGYGTATITHTYTYSYRGESTNWYWVTKTGTDVWSVTVKGGVVATALELPETASVQRDKTVVITPTVLEPSDAVITWSSSDTSVATVDKSGRVTGVAPGTTTIVARSGNLVAATTVTVTGSNTGNNVKGASFYYAVSPSAILTANETKNWQSLGWANSAVDLTGATWEQGTTSGSKNTFDNVESRILVWPDGQTGSTYTVSKGSDTWNYVFTNWKDEVEKELGVTISEDDITSIILVPVKVSDNGGDSNYHVDCSVNVETKGVVMAKYMLQDAGGTEFVTNEAYKFIANKGETSPKSEYPESKTVNGHTYSFSGWYDNAECTGTPVEFPYTVGDSNLTFYAKYVRSDVKYTVNYYLNGTTTKVADSVTKAAGTPGIAVSETPKTINGYTPVSNSKVQIVVDEEDGKNVINFYYYKNIELTANSAEYTYDGSEKTVSGYTSSVATAAFDGIANPTASGTNVGTYDAKFADGTVGTVSTNKQYIVSAVKDGTLTIKPVEAEIVINVTGANNSTKYDGASHSVEGYTISTENTLLNTETDVVYSGGTTAPKAERTDAGTTNMGLKESQFALTEAAAKNFTNVKFVVTDGYQTITKRDVTLTSGSAEKPYDGQALTKDEVTVSGDGFVAGNILGIGAQGVDYKVTGTITNVGETENTFEYTVKEGTNLDNYNITTEFGTLKVTPVADKVTVTIQENSGTAKYDGTEHEVSGYAVKSIQINGKDTELYTANDFSFSGNATVKGTDAGTYDMELKASDFTNTSTNFTNVEFVIEDGSLTISKRDVTLTSATDSKTYDGTALTNKNVTVGGDGFVAGEGASYDVTGSQTKAGTSKNAFTYTLNDGTKAGNYNISKTEGELTVTKSKDKVVVVITENSDTKKYNGSEQSVTGYTVTSISSKLYTEKDFTFSGDATAKGTDAGTYDMNLKDSDFKNTNDNFDNVEFQIVDGKLTIQKREITLTSATDSKTYDGKALTNDKVTVGGDGFAEGEGATYDVTGTITNAGSVPNSFEYKLNEGTDAKNYDITPETGTLTVNPVKDEITIKVAGNKESKDYTGSEQTTTGYSVTDTGSELVGSSDVQLANGSKAEAKGTEVGEYKMGLKDSDFTLSETMAKNFENVKFEVTDGQLTITPAAIADFVELIPTDVTKTYDGNSYAAGTATATDKFGKTVTVEYSVDGKTWTTDPSTITATNVVDSKTIQVRASVDGTYEGYVTTTQKLTITPAAVTVTAQDASKIYGAADPSFTATASGLIASDQANAAELIKYNVTRPNAGTDEAVGTYADAIVASGNETQGNYSVTYVPADFTITTKSIVPVDPDPENPDSDTTSVTCDTPGNHTYDGQAHEWTPTLSDPQTGKTLEAGKDYTVEYSTDDFTNVTGTITVTIKAAEGSNYTGGFTRTYQITPRSVTLTSASDAKVYDGTPLTNNKVTISGDGFVDGEVSDVTATGTITAVGETANTIAYTKNSSFKDANYSITEVPGTLTVTAQSIIPDPENPDDHKGVEVGKVKDVVYNGQSQELKPSVTDKDGNALKEGSDYTLSWSDDTTNAGEVTVTVTGAGNYKGTTTVTYNILKREVIVDTETASKNYDGETLTAPAKVQAATDTTGFVAGEGATFTATTIGPDVTAKTNNVITETEWNANTKESNYTVKNGTIGTLEITAAAAENVTCTDPSDVTYNGKDQTWAPEVSDTKTGKTLTEGTDYTVTYDKADRTNVASIVVTIVGKGNYEGIKFEKTYQILAKEVTVTTGSASKVYDGTALTKDEATLAGVIEGETYEIKATGSQTTIGSTANTYKITWAADGNDLTAKESNYTVKTENLGTLTVTAQSIDPNTPDKNYSGVEVGTLDDVMYNGQSQAQKPTVTDKDGNALVEGTDYKLTFSTDTTNAGKVTVTIEGMGNYTGTVTREYSITPRTVTLTSDTASKAYDGTALTRPNVTVAGDGFVDGEVTGLTATGSVTTVEEGTVTNTITFAKGESYKDSNYSITKTEGTLSITAQSIDPTDPSYNGVEVGTLERVVYNGESQVQKPTVTDKDGKALKEGTDYEITFSEDTTNAGTVTVTVTGKGDYSGTVTRTYKITKRTVKIDTNTNSKPYDGKELVGIATLNPPVATQNTGLVNGETLIVSATTIGPNVTVQTTNAYTIDWAKSTAQERNYNVEKGTIGTLEITAAKLEGVTCDEASNKTYNGQDQTFVPTVTDTKLNTTLVVGTDYDVAYSTTDRTNVTGEIKVTVTGKGNYAGYTFTTSYQITAAPLTVVTPDGTKVYDGAELTNSEGAGATGYVNSETATFNVVGTQTAVGESANAYTLSFSDVTIQFTQNADGTYTATQATAGAGDANATAKSTNYAITNNLGTLKVTAQSIDPGNDPENPNPSYKGIEVGTLSDVVYNATSQAQKPTVTSGETSLVEGQDYTISFSEDTINAGTVTVTVTGVGNYTGTVTRTYKITPRPVTVIAASASKTYDGNALTDERWSVEPADMEKNTGLVGTDSIDSVTVTGSQTLVGESANVASAAAFATELIAANYTVNYQNGKLVVTDGSDEDPFDESKAITKTHEANEYKYGETVTFTITATNIYAEAKTMTIFEQEGVTLVNANENGQVVFENVTPGAEVTATATHVITEADILAGTFTNTATVAYSGTDKTFEGKDTVGTDGTGTIEEKNAHLTVTKTTTNNPDKTKVFQVGDVLEYEVLIENDGNVTIKNINVTDELAGVVLRDGESETIESLAPGESATLHYTYTVTEADIVAGTGKTPVVTNKVTVAGEDPENEKTDGSDETSDAIPSKFKQVTVYKSATLPGQKNAAGYDVGDEITYKVTLLNNGNVTVTDPYFVDEMLKDSECTGVVDGNGNAVEWTRSDDGNVHVDGYSVAPGASLIATYTYVATEADVIAGKLTNYAQGHTTFTNSKGGKEDVWGHGSCNTHTPKSNPHMTITKTVTNKNEATGKDGKWAAGDVIKYSVTVINDGNLTLTNVKVTDELVGKTDESTDWTVDSLAPKASETFTAEYTVTEKDVIAGKVVNQATGTATSPDPKKPTPVTPGEETEETETKNPSLDVTKTTTSTMPEGGYKAGDKIDYTITVTNNGNLTINDITVTDELTGNGAENPLATGLTLAPGETKDYAASYTVTEADTLADTTVTNTAVAKGTDPTGKTVEKTGTKEDTNVEGKPEVKVVKAVTNKNEATGSDAQGNKVFQAGDTIKYTITVENLGNVTLANTVVTDSLAGVKLTKTSQGTIDGSTVNVGELAPNATATIEAEYVVTEADVVKGSIANTATAKASAKDDSNKTTEDKSTVTTGPEGNGGDLVDPNGHMKVEKETTSTAEAEDGKYILGEEITYKVTVTNDGNLTLTNVKIIDNLEGVVLTSGAGSDTVASLAPGASAEATYSYKVAQKDILAGNVHNDATATATSPDSKEPGVTPDTTDDKTDSPNGHMTVKKEVTNKSDATGAVDADGNKTWAAGDTIKYTITVTNDGNLDLTGVKVTDELTGDEWEIEGTFKQGATETFEATYEVTEADTVKGYVYNQATATGTSPDTDNPTPGVTPGDSTEDTEKGAAKIEITKETTSEAAAEDGKYVLGEVIKYKVTVANTGNLTAADVKVTDELEGARRTSGSENISELKPGDSTELTYEYTVTEADIVAGQVVNNATATVTIPADPDNPTDPVDPDKTTDETEEANAHLTVTKSTDNKGEGSGENGAFKAGETIHYTVTVENDGNQTINDVVVTDQLAGAELAEGENAELGTMKPGDKAELHYSYIVTEADTTAGTTITNLATATGTTPENVPDPKTDDGTTTDDVEPEPEPEPVTPTTPETPETPTTPTTPAGPTTPDTAPAATTTTPATSPAAPASPAAPTTPTTPAENLPTPLDVIVPALEAGATAVEEAITGEPAATEEVIDDDGTALAGREGRHCWVHFYIMLGILINALYVAGVIIRRLRFGRKVKDYDDDLLDKGKKTGNDDETATAPTTNLGAQPAMMMGQEA